MHLIQKHRFKRQLVLLFFCLLIMIAGCDDREQEFEEKGPKKQESRRVIVDVNIITIDEKTTFEAMFYYDIAGLVDGQEVSGLRKEIIKVKDAKLGENALKETKDDKNRIIYTAEIQNEANEYKLSFAPNENASASHKIKVAPIFIKAENRKLEKSKIHELELSRAVIRGELPAIVELKKNDNFLPARIEYLNQKLFFNENALKPFPIGNNILRVRFESIPNQRDENKSIRNLNYIINKSIEIVD